MDHAQRAARAHLFRRQIFRLVGRTAEARRIVKTEDFVAVWKLAECYERGKDGERLEGPLGPDPVGMLIYTAEGYVSVTMTRTSGTAEAPGASDSVGYAGTWRACEGQVHHTIQMTSPVTAWTGSEQVRTVAHLDSDRLTLEGSEVIDGELRTAVLEWTRAPSRPTAS